MEHFECEGAPRDMGADQGRACRAALRAQTGPLRRLPVRLRDPQLRRALRELQRHYPHQHEQLSGMARAAGLSVSRLARASLAALHAQSRALGYRERGAARILVSAPLDAVQRHSRAEGRFAARELTRPVLTTALLAVNESGLTAAVSGLSSLGGGAASGALLVRDCVERFESVEAASEWCLARPCAPGVSILLADARDELAAVEIGADARRIRLPVDSVLLPGSLSVHARVFAKSLGDAPTLKRLLDSTLGAFVSADPRSQSLSVSER